MFGGLLKIFHIGETESSRIGRLGENAAAKFLRRNLKMKIAERNYRNGRDEIDIIAYDGDALVFIEVKTRSARAVVDGYFAAVSQKKLAALKRCARGYMRRLKDKPDTWRFDAVDVRHDGKGNIVSVAHFPNVG